MAFADVMTEIEIEIEIVVQSNNSHHAVLYNRANRLANEKIKRIVLVDDVSRRVAIGMNDTMINAYCAKKVCASIMNKREDSRDVLTRATERLIPKFTEVLDKCKLRHMKDKVDTKFAQKEDFIYTCFAFVLQGFLLVGVIFLFSKFGPNGQNDQNESKQLSHNQHSNLSSDDDDDDDSDSDSD